MILCLQGCGGRREGWVPVRWVGGGSLGGGRFGERVLWGMLVSLLDVAQERG
jgi:hypothetical protein